MGGRGSSKGARGQTPATPTGASGESEKIENTAQTSAQTSAQTNTQTESKFMKQAKADLDKIISDYIYEAKRGLPKQFADEVKTLDDALYWGNSFGGDIKRVKKALDSGDTEKIRETMDDYERLSKDLAAPWYDEDIGEYRSGYHEDAKFYEELAQICRIAIRPR